MNEASSERRRFDRVATDKAITVDTPQGKADGVVVDISLRGALLDLGGDWRPGNGDAVRAHIRLDDGDCCIDFEGEVAHVEGERVGLHCLVLDLDSASRLRRLVELNLADPELLERNLAELINS
jgi:hypothetical protein